MEKEDNFYLTKNLQAKKFKEVCYFFNQKDLQEFYLNEGGTEIILKKTIEVPQYVQASPISQVVQAAPTANLGGRSDPADESKPQQASDNGDGIESPISGTYYSAPSPDSPPFVNVGDKVKEGQVVAIIEAMKIMNKVKATKAGTVSEILLNNGDSVQKGMKFILLK